MLTTAQLSTMLRVNLFGALYVMQEAATAMRRRGSGHIVNIASLAGRRGISPLGGYSATKFALIGLTEALRLELAGSGLHVSLILPGVVETPLADAFQSGEDGDIWPRALNMKPEWVVWAIYAALRFRLVEVSVPPGAALLEKLAALMPGAADGVLGLATRARRRSLRS